MGLFSFIKSAGRGLLEKSTLNNRSKKRSDAEMKARQEGMLEGMIYNAGLKIEHLDIDLDGDKAIIYGETQHTDHRNRAVLLLGNVSGISEVDDRISVTVTEAQPYIYEVQSGDSLSKIAKKFYGDVMLYNKIFEANQNIIDDPNLIYPGQKIIIPDYTE